MADIVEAVSALFLFLPTDEQSEHLERLEGAIGGGPWPLQPAPDIDNPGVGVRADILKDGQPQWRHGIPCAPDDERHGLWPGHTDCQRPPHNLAELLGKARRH